MLKTEQIGARLKRVKHVSLAIERSAQDVYAFVAEPMNLTKWASGLSTGAVEKNGDAIIVDSPMGRVRVQFAAKNELGVLDHDVTLESGETFHNPMRVVPNDHGSEVTFMLFQQPDMSDEKFETDASWILKDLLKLKSLLENA